MARTRAKAIFLLAVLAGPLALLAVACSRPAEQQILQQFFRASRARDNATLAMMAAVSLDPREQGAVDRFTITNVSEEQRTALDLKGLVAKVEQARASESEFSARKKEYQDANLAVIEQVLKLEREPTARMSPAQQEVKAAWDKWREDTATFARGVSDARSALGNAVGPIEGSLAQPGGPAFNPVEFEGALVSKQVTVDADMVSPEGSSSQIPLTVTMQRAEGTLAGQPVTGRWIITRLDGV